MAESPEKAEPARLTVILIPAYEPDEHLIRLIESIVNAGCRYPVVIVNDGSADSHDGIFARAQQLGCVVLSHHPNRGKGFALRHGIDHIVRHFPDHAVICADCDGQHAVGDILRVAQAPDDDHRAIVLGARQFGATMPIKSRVGNDATRLLFRLATGVRLQDTQTGLRCYPASLLGWLGTIEGDRFEYELSVLLAAAAAGIVIIERPIESIYLDGNKSTHFRPLHDSIRVYLPFLKFGPPSLRRFVVRKTLTSRPRHSG